MNSHIKAHNFFVNESGVFVNPMFEALELPAEFIQLEMF
jgi:hypothetical protein